MMSQEIFWVASASAAWIGLSVAGLSMAFAMLSYRRAFHEERTRLYLELRRRYFEGRKGLSPRYFNDAEEPLETENEWYSAEQYWYHAFDEWFATNKLNKGAHKDLWDLYFGPAVQSTLKARPMRKVVWRMTQGRVSFGTYRSEFRDVLDDLWKKQSKDNHNLSDGFNN